MELLAKVSIAVVSYLGINGWSNGLALVQMFLIFSTTFTITMILAGLVHLCKAIVKIGKKL